MFQKLFNLAKEILYPIYCVECGREGEWWCDKCLSGRQDYAAEFNPDSEMFSGAFAFAQYSELSPVGKLLRAYKYNFASDIESVWNKIIIPDNKINSFIKIIPADNRAIIPVPLYHRRERERGFNQSTVIARLIAKNIFQNTILADEKNFIRVRYTAQQAKLNKNERLQNVRGAFAWRVKSACPENVILVDDVFTTGATLESCAGALRQAGAKKVCAITFALASPQRSEGGRANHDA